nr:hypothetical protein CFP56_18602 [Quercus suber]
MEIDMELNKFEKGNISGSRFDKDSNLKEDASTDHVTQLVSNQSMHVEALFPYEDHSGSLLSQNLSK